MERAKINVKRTLTFLTICALFFAFCVCGQAQQPAKIPRIGFVSGAGDSKNPGPSFRRGLRDLGYIEGKNIIVEYRYIEGNRDRISSIVAEFVQLKVDVAVTSEQSWVRAAEQVTKTIPIVMVINGDPVATGLVESLARPGGNITGLTRLNRELSGKRLELLKEAVPTISRVGVLTGVDATTLGVALKEYQAAARALKIPFQSLEVRGPNPDLEGAFEAAVKGRVNGIITIRSSLMNRYSKRVADLAIKNRLPSMYEGSQYVEAGGLMSYSTNDAESFKRAAVYVDKILKGTKPADLPVEQPTKFELVINLKTAQELGFKIPPKMLMWADKVIK